MINKHFRNIIVLRTNIYSARWDTIFSKLPSNVKIMVVADCRNENFVFNNGISIGYNIDNVSCLKLPLADDMQWRFGDYAIYLADDYLKNNEITYDYIWIIEPDFHITIDFYSFICGFDSNDADFITTYFEPADDSWMWSKYSNEMGYQKVYKTFFPFVRLKSNLVSELLDSRIKYPSLANDESFVASFIGNNNFKFDLFSNYIKYNRNSFSYRLPHYIPFIRYYLQAKSDIYHPAFDRFLDYAEHLKKRSSWKKVLKRVLLINNYD